MKKLMVSFALCLLTVLLCSCGIPVQKQECFFMPERFKCDVFVTINNKDYSGILERSDCEYCFIVTKPESMNGLEVNFKDGKYEMNFKESTTSFDTSNGFFLDEVISFIEQSVGKEVKGEREGDRIIVINENVTLSFDNSV